MSVRTRSRLLLDRLTPATAVPGGGRAYAWGQTQVAILPPHVAPSGLPEVRTSIEGVGCLQVRLSDSEEQRQFAAHFGYGYGNWLALNLSHDPLHTALSVACGLPWSPTLRAVMRDRHTWPAYQPMIHREECAVWALARLLTQDEWWPAYLAAPPYSLTEDEVRRLGAHLRPLLGTAGRAPS